MRNDPSTRHVRVPVQMVDGVWECVLGGPVPVKDGAHGELILPRGSIADKGFLQAMTRQESHKILEEGATLMVAMKIKPGAHSPPEIFHPTLKSWEWARDNIAKGYLYSWGLGEAHFVQVTLAGANHEQARRFGGRRGGLWLLTKGVEATGLASTTVLLPPAISDAAVQSLNHAYTKLSEIFEPWRISHTGNIYHQVLYMEKDGKWYPLDVLRNRDLVNQETEIANEIWEASISKMNSQRIAK